MSEPICVRYSANTYCARKRLAEGVGVVINLCVTMQSGAVHATCLGDEELARRWLCDRSLRKSRAKKLLAAALRNEGDYANPNHPKRLAISNAN